MLTRRRAGAGVNENEEKDASTKRETEIEPEIDAKEQQPTRVVRADVAFVRQLFTPVPAYSVAALRIFWGLVMFYEMTTYMNDDYHKADRYLAGPLYMFKYWAFDWVPRITLDQCRVFFPVMCAFALCFSIGFLYRVSAIGFFVGFCFIYLQDMGLYLNHFYLIVVLCFAYCFLPANRFLAVDAYIGLAPKSDTVPYWSVWLVRFLVSNVYVWAGIAKMNEDWIRCEPLVHWVPRARLFPPLAWLGVPWVQSTVEMACFMSWSGLMLDTFAPFFLAWRPTRLLAFMATMAFHVTNKVMLNIGIFPYAMIAISFIYFDPDWPSAPLHWYRAIVARLTRAPQAVPVPTPLPSAPLPYDPAATTLGSLWHSFSLGNKSALVFMLVLCAQQVLFPLRHLYYPGDVVWNEEGHRYSWRMKLRDKTGFAQFFVTSHVTNATYLFDPVVDYPFRMLTSKQSKKMPGRPEMIHLFVHHLAERFNATEGAWPEVRVLAICTVNNRVPQFLVDPNVDLAKLPPWSWPNKWVVDLLPRGDFDWRVVPWPVCKGRAHKQGSTYSRTRLYDMYEGFTLKDAQQAFGRAPPTEAEAERDCDEIRDQDVEYQAYRHKQHLGFGRSIDKE